MDRRITAGVLATGMLLVLWTVPAAALTSPNWNLNGTYTIPFTCVTGCPSPPDYPYSVTITTTSSDTGAVTGTGYYISGGGYPAVTVAGQVTGWDLTLNLTYDDPALASYNPFVLTGSIDKNGGMAGEAVDGQGRTFTWRTTSGTVSLFSACPAGATFVPATGGVVTAPTIPGHPYEIAASGTYFAGGTGAFDIQADAEYSQDAVQRNADAAWTNSVNGYESYGEVLLDLTVDGANVNWGAYSPAHTYTITKAATASQMTFAFEIYDIYAPNNTGGLCVSLTDVSYGFEGFFSPIDNTMSNVAKAGQSIPVKWRLLDHEGQPVSDPASFVSLGSKASGGACAGLPSDAIETYAGMSGLQYLGDGYWQFNWKTPRGYAGQCRTMTLTLLDGSTHSASFTFK